MNIRIFLITFWVFLLWLLIFLGIWAYNYYSAIHADDPINPTLSVEEGSSTIIRGDLAIDLSFGESYILKNGDAIETKSASKATVTWPDRSITRLGENTRITIRKMEVSQNYETIRISYDIKRGKVWNTIIRSILGDSYFEARLPKNDIVAAVRGTVFEINLDAAYIHAVSHDTVLSDNSGKNLALLPWEMVSSENIWIHRGREWLDTTWASWNTNADIFYQKSRTLLMEKSISLLSGKWKEGNYWDRFVRWILSFFQGFQEIKISKMLSLGNIESLKNNSETTLIKYYQKLQSTDLIEMRDRVRWFLVEQSWTSPNKKTLMNSLKHGALWDSLDFPTETLTASKKALWNTFESIKWNFQEIQKSLQSGGEIDIKIRESFNSFLK